MALRPRGAQSGKSRQLRIRHSPDPPQVVPIHFLEQSIPPASTPFAFIYRGVRVLCTPLRSKDGRIANLEFECPRCRRRQDFDHDQTLTLFPDGLIEADKLVRCPNRRPCGLCILIVDGQATDVTRRA